MWYGVTCCNNIFKFSTHTWLKKFMFPSKNMFEIKKFEIRMKINAPKSVSRLKASPFLLKYKYWTHSEKVQFYKKNVFLAPRFLKTGIIRYISEARNRSICEYFQKSLQSAREVAILLWFLPEKSQRFGAMCDTIFVRKQCNIWNFQKKWEKEHNYSVFGKRRH